MLAAWLTTVVWVCFAAAVTGQTIWAFTDGRRPEMPQQLYDSMIGAVGTMMLAPIIILLDIYSPDRLASFGVLMLLGLTLASFRGQHLTRPDKPIYPMTPAWQAAARRSAQLSGLFVASAGALVLIARPESIAICALGAITAMNLRRFTMGCRDDRLDSWSRIWMLMSFVLPFAAWYASRDHGILREGLNITYADLSLQVHASIPGNDAASVELLQSYICFMLVFHLLTMVVEVAGRGKALADIVLVLLRFLRGGILLMVLLFLLPDYPTASALFIKYLLFAIEVATLMAPTPNNFADTATTKRQDAANPA